MIIKKKLIISVPPIVLLLAVMAVYAENEVLGEIKFVGLGKIEKKAGVWIDGQYVGYLSELKGRRKIMLLPGAHEVVVRHVGYKDFSRSVVLEPGQRYVLQVAMEKDLEARYPDVTGELKISVKPNRAAVFVDDRFVGHVDEFDGPSQALLLPPGKHRVKITLPGYQTLETEINLLAKQKIALKADLFKQSITQASSLIDEKKTEKAEAK